MAETINAIFLEHVDDEESPVTSLLKVTHFSGSEDMDAVVSFQIGDYDEDTYEFDFKSSAERAFSVNRDDLLRALIGIGTINEYELPNE